MSTPRVDLTEAELREGLTACLPVPRWVEEVVAAAPFGSLLELLDVAAAAATPLSPAEVNQALADHPRMGRRGSAERPAPTPGASEGVDLDAALADGYRAYEERFGRVFLIRAAGRSRPEILTELRRRLELDPATDVGIVASELRDIALLRIPQLFAHLDHHSGFDDPEAAQ